MIALTPEQTTALRHALDKVETTLGREDVADLRDVLRVILDPTHPKSKKFVEYQLWDIEQEAKEEAEATQ